MTTALTMTGTTIQRCVQQNDRILPKWKKKKRKNKWNNLKRLFLHFYPEKLPRQRKFILEKQSSRLYINKYVNRVEPIIPLMYQIYT